MTEWKITVVRGKTVSELKPKQIGKAEILKQVMGPSGNLRVLALAMPLVLWINYPWWCDR